jgi:Flp pilus assembly protein TadG
MRIKTDGEGGQTLVLFALMLAVLVVFVVMVVDVGMFMEQRRHAQNVVDAAALAGAQELPDSPAAAATLAKQYADLNGYDSSKLQISFRCTSNASVACNPSANKYDTIVVKATADSPAYFGPILSVLGGGGLCWTTGCSTTVQAAGCRGFCGAAGSQEDVVVTIDHTGSMQATELQNAKDGALQLMKILDPAVHRIALAETPPVHTANPCDTVETWVDADRTWLPAGLSSNYATSAGTLNASSLLVKDTQCMDLAGSGDVPGPHTDLAEPMRAATKELQTNGRSTAGHAIVLETDGAANVYADPAAAAAAGALGPCDYAYKMATKAKALGYEIFTIGYGVDENCTHDSTKSPWYNKPATQLLLQMATDASHFYNQPKTADLDPVFQAIGNSLASGSKLVQ